MLLYLAVFIGSLFSYCRIPRAAHVLDGQFEMKSGGKMGPSTSRQHIVLPENGSLMHTSSNADTYSNKIMVIGFCSWRQI